METPTPVPADSADALRYNRIRRWLSVSDFVVGLAFLIVLLVTGWSGWLRDFAYRLGQQNYTLSVFLYLVLLLTIGKALGIGLEYFGFRLERKFKLSTQRFASWAWDEIKGFPPISAALVVHRLGLVHVVVHRDGATGARRAVSDLLQIRASR